MTKKSQEAYQRIQDAIGKEGEGLVGSDWYEFLEELSSHVESLVECYREENPEEFE